MPRRDLGGSCPWRRLAHRARSRQTRPSGTDRAPWRAQRPADRRAGARDALVRAHQTRTPAGFWFFVPFRNKFLDAAYIMRNSIKNNPARKSSSQTAKEAQMDLYFSPMACSLATRIALYEAGAEANFLEVDPRTKLVQNDGSNFRDVNPLALVPTLRTDDGQLLTENAAVLQYVGDRFADAGISTAPGIERSRLHQWLCFVGTELHKGLFSTLLDRKAPPEVKAYIL